MNVFLQYIKRDDVPLNAFLFFKKAWYKRIKHFSKVVNPITRGPP